MPAAKPKNRRARNAKISEYRLRKLVLAFAQDMTVRDAAKKTGLSEPTVRQHFMTLRQRLYDHGFLRVNRREGDRMPARIIFAKKHRGVPERYAHLYEAEFLNRAFATKNVRRVWKFAASNAHEMEKLKTFVAYNKLNDKYDIIEALAAKSSEKRGKTARSIRVTTRPQAPLSSTSATSIRMRRSFGICGSCY